MKPHHLSTVNGTFKKLKLTKINTSFQVTKLIACHEISLLSEKD